MLWEEWVQRCCEPNLSNRAHRTWSAQYLPRGKDSCPTSGQKAQYFLSQLRCARQDASLPRTQLPLGGGSKQTWIESTQWLNIIRLSQTISTQLWETRIRGDDLCLQTVGEGFHKENPPGTERVRKRNDDVSEKSIGGGRRARDRKQACLGPMHFLGWKVTTPALNVLGVCDFSSCMWNLEGDEFKQ